MDKELIYKAAQRQLKKELVGLFMKYEDRYGLTREEAAEFFDEAYQDLPLPKTRDETNKKEKGD